MRELFRFICPYCSYPNNRQLEVPESHSDQYEVVYCDLEEGGCDNLILIRKEVFVRTVAFAIEGEGEGE